MRREPFVLWLQSTPQPRGRPLPPNAASGYASHCAKAEEGVGDLDEAFDADSLQAALADLAGIQAACSRGQAAPAWLRTTGDPIKVLGNLRCAVRAYAEFRRNPARGTAAPTTMPPRASDEANWPRWESPSDDDLLALARVVARHARFLSAALIAAVAEDTAARGDEWGERLRGLGVDPSPFLWPRGACAFPGVRRRSGKKELQEFNAGRRTGLDLPRPTLLLDDNTYPKHAWSFALRGREFKSKSGPPGYQLAHLADHAVYKNRCATEFEGTAAAAAPAGLFTAPWNTVYVPDAFLKPTDAGDRLRRLLQRRAFELYGDVCALVPSGARPMTETDARWQTDRFEWAPSVGDPRHFGAFLEFRAAATNAMLEEAERARSPYAGVPRTVM